MLKLIVMMILNKRSSRCLQAAVVGIMVSLVSGCIWVEDTADLSKFVSDVQAKPKGKIEPLPTFKSYNSFVYQGASLRDPFEPLVRVVSTVANFEQDNNSLQPDQDRPRSYLEQFSFDQLLMVGTIGKADEDFFWALLLDDNHEIHRVKVGDYLGLDFGRVVAVSDQQLDVVEIISNGRGGWMKRPRTIELAEQK
ncbi:type IV pilus assembly protein PilP [Neptunomonas antarctica]|uniref:Type IV pilus assembly protein PilP n=2 Tax=Neptunomonas antarctica TaxID=619304 RepID=A0A1N7J305_9GAMM|nr:type IV pilus assembly protein PilP [Neptunomonas antarctica]